MLLKSDHIGLTKSHFKYIAIFIVCMNCIEDTMFVSMNLMCKYIVYSDHIKENSVWSNFSGIHKAIFCMWVFIWTWDCHWVWARCVLLYNMWVSDICIHCYGLYIKDFGREKGKCISSILASYTVLVCCRYICSLKKRLRNGPSPRIGIIIHSSPLVQSSK